MFYYSHHIGDLIRDTANLDDHQLATYMRMLWSYYDTEKPLENNPEDLAFALRSNEKTVQLLLKHYFKLDGDVWRHTRCDIEIADYHSKKEKASNSAKARWSNAKSMPTNSERNANASKQSANLTVLHANQEPRTKNQESIGDSGAKAPRATKRCPSDFLITKEMKDWAVKECIDVDIEKSTAIFRDHTFPTARTDWIATWRNWIRRDQSYKSPKTQNTTSNLMAGAI